MPNEMLAADPTLWGLRSELREDPGGRTQHSKLFTNPDGSKTSYLSSNLHYQARPGEWEAQNLRFRKRGADHLADRHWFHTRISNAGIDVTDPETGVGIRWILPSRPAVADRRASFSADGVTWEYTVGPRRLKLEGTVTSPLGAKTHTFRYRLLGNAADFSIENGQAVSPGLNVAAPIIIGANGLVYSTPGWILLPGSRLSFTFDDSLLPPEAYPYVIDPTTTIQPDATAGKDGQITDHAATTNYETQNEMNIGDALTAATRAWRSLIKFDVSVIDSSDAVSAVTLSLYEQSATYSNASDETISLNRLLRDWVEAEFTWTIWKTSNNWTTAGAGSDGNDRSSTVTASLEVDETAAVDFIDWADTQLISDVQNFVDGGLSNFGWLFTSTAEFSGAEHKWNSFRTSDHATADNRPKLVVVHLSADILMSGLGFIQGEDRVARIATGMRPL